MVAASTPAPPASIPTTTGDSVWLECARGYRCLAVSLKSNHRSAPEPRSLLAFLSNQKGLRREWKNTHHSCRPTWAIRTIQPGDDAGPPLAEGAPQCPPRHPPTHKRPLRVA